MRRDNLYLQFRTAMFVAIILKETSALKVTRWKNCKERKKKKRLKLDAVPSIFNFPTSILVGSTSRKSRENRKEKKSASRSQS